MNTTTPALNPSRGSNADLCTKYRGLINSGFSVHQIKDIRDLDNAGDKLQTAHPEKWFVSVDVDSPYRAEVLELALADSAEQAWELATEKFEDGDIAF